MCLTSCPVMAGNSVAKVFLGSSLPRAFLFSWWRGLRILILVCSQGQYISVTPPALLILLSFLTSCHCQRFYRYRAESFPAISFNTQASQIFLTQDLLGKACWVSSTDFKLSLHQNLGECFEDMKLFLPPPVALGWPTLANCGAGAGGRSTDMEF